MTGTFLAPAWQGFGLGAGLIIAIGAQNAFVLRQGIRRAHVFPVTTFCFLADALLIAAGVAGMGTLVASNPTFTLVAAVGGAAFLFVYGLRAFRQAWRPGTLKAAERPSGQRRARLAIGAADRGGADLPQPARLSGYGGGAWRIAGQYAAEERLVFGIGAAVASAVWFYGLGYGASVLAPMFAKPVAWRVLDGIIGCVMWGIALALVQGLLA